MKASWCRCILSRPPSTIKRNRFLIKIMNIRQCDPPRPYIRRTFLFQEHVCRSCYVICKYKFIKCCRMAELSHQLPIKESLTPLSSSNMLGSPPAMVLAGPRSHWVEARLGCQSKTSAFHSPPFRSFFNCDTSDRKVASAAVEALKAVRYEAVAGEYALYSTARAAQALRCFAGSVAPRQAHGALKIVNSNQYPSRAMTSRVNSLQDCISTVMTSVHANLT